MTSPPRMVLSAHQVWPLMLFLMKWTLPSPKTMFRPPGCLLPMILA